MLEVRPTEVNGHTADSTLSDCEPIQFVESNMAPKEKSFEDIVTEMDRSIWSQIQDFYNIIHEFDTFSYTDKFNHLASMAARASHFRSQIYRMPKSEKLTSLRVHHVDPFLKAVQTQFEIQSRNYTVSQDEQKMYS